MRKTAAELSKDKKYQVKKKNREEKVKSFEDRLKADQASLINHLKDVGIYIESVWDLVNKNSSYKEAIPVLLQHIALVHK